MTSAGGTLPQQMAGQANLFARMGLRLPSPPKRQPRALVWGNPFPHQEPQHHETDPNNIAEALKIKPSLIPQLTKVGQDLRAKPKPRECLLKQKVQTGPPLS